MGAPLRLVADIGGTHARFALCEPNVRPPKPAVFLCQDYPDITSALAQFLDQDGNGRLPADGVVAVAGPVTGETVTLTNHPWRFEIETLRRSLGIGRLCVINDFSAIALSLPHLEEADLRKVGDGRSATNSVLGVIGPGTGLGVSALVPGGGQGTPLMSEGGHVDFAPIDTFETEIFRWLSARFEHVSLERVVSGSGLVNLFRAICHVEGKPEVSREVPDGEDLSAGDIVYRAASGDCPISARTIETFCAILGGAAGNLALTVGARGGVFVAGGMVLKLGEQFAEGPFRRRFVAKGRFSAYLREIPTYVILEPNPALIGLSHFTAE